jgi:hypothetical protein
VSVEVAAIALTLLAHVVGAGVLVYTLLDGEGFDWRTLWPRDDDGGDGGGGGDWDEPLLPEGPGGGDGLLPDAAPSAVRLREPGRIADGYPNPGRRPQHAPERPRPRVGEPS